MTTRAAQRKIKQEPAASRSTRHAVEPDGRGDNLALLDGVPAPVVAIDTDYKITRVNRAAATLLKLAPEQCIGKTCHELLKTTHCGTKDCACAHAMSDGASVTSETVALPAGVPTPIRYTAAPLKNGAGEIVGAVEYLVDISKEREQSVQTERALQALRGVPTPVLSISRDFTVLAMNEAGAQLVGLAPEQCVGRKCYDLFKTEHCRTERCACQQAMVKEGSFTEETVARPHGSPVPIRYTGAPIRDAAGQVMGAAEFVLDISAEVQSRAHNAEVTRVLFQLQKNDLSARVQGKYSPELERVSLAINGGLDSINRVLHEVVGSVQQVSDTAAEVSAASQRLASGAQEQAAAVEETTAGLAQADAQIKANAGNASVANQLVGATNETATKGRAEMERMLAAMAAISESSQSISKIMKVIDEIAFQTNILALNAAVEAARAGKYGRGFAVVAQEVRNLAGRSAKAARETAELIEASNKKVEHGAAIAGTTAKALDEIVFNVTKVSDLVAEITTASREQSQSVSQMTEGMTQISSAVSDVSAQSEETAAAAEELSGIADGLKTLVAAFKLSEREHPRSARFEGLPEGVTPAMLEQLLALMRNPAVLQSVERARGVPSAHPPDNDLSPAEILPFDTDPRGYGEFQQSLPPMPTRSSSRRR